MKTAVMVFAILWIFCSLSIAADDCESEYENLLNELEESNMPLKEKEKFLEPLKEALQLCKEGKDDQAAKIVKDLKNKGLSIEAFDSLSGN